MEHLYLHSLRASCLAWPSDATRLLPRASARKVTMREDVFIRRRWH